MNKVKSDISNILIPGTQGNVAYVQLSFLQKGFLVWKYLQPPYPV